MKLSSAKFAPRCGERAIWKSTLLKTDGLGAFSEVQAAFCVASAGVLARCKIRGRHGSENFLRGRRRDVGLCHFDVCGLGR